MNYGLDIDGVVCDFVTNARQLAEKLGLDVSDRDLVIDYEDMPDSYESALEERPFWLNMKPIKTSWHVVNDLFGKGHNVHFITSRAKDSAILVTGRWLEEWGFMYSDLHFASNGRKVELYKELELDIFVDDNPSVVNAISQVGMGVLMSQEYNLDDEVGVRIDDLLDLYELRL
jgi:uncharacterized HAD superfamily protein